MSLQMPLRQLAGTYKDGKKALFFVFLLLTSLKLSKNLVDDALISLKTIMHVTSNNQEVARVYLGETLGSIVCDSTTKLFFVEVFFCQRWRQTRAIEENDWLLSEQLNHVLLQWCSSWDSVSVTGRFLTHTPYRDLSGNLSPVSLR